MFFELFLIDIPPKKYFYRSPPIRYRNFGKPRADEKEIYVKSRAISRFLGRKLSQVYYSTKLLFIAMHNFF